MKSVKAPSRCTPSVWLLRQAFIRPLRHQGHAPAGGAGQNGGLHSCREFRGNAFCDFRDHSTDLVAGDPWIDDERIQSTEGIQVGTTRIRAA